MTAQCKRSTATHEDDTVKSLLEPRRGVLLLHPVLRANARLLLLPPRHPCARSAHHNVEIHSENTDTGVVTRTEIDVLLDTETEVSGLREVLAAELVLLDLETTLKNLLCLGAADGDVNGNLLVTTDTECSDGVAGLGGDGCLAGKLFEHLRSSGQTITRLADGNVW